MKDTRNVTHYLKKQIEIRIGNELLINKIGVLLAFIGILSALFIIAVFVSGTMLPFEMKFIYFVEVIGLNWYIAMLISIMSVIIGIEISNLRIYSKTNLILHKDKIEFIKKGKLIELKKWKISKISKKKSFLLGKERIKIKTVTNKEYCFKAENILLDQLNELFPFKISSHIKNNG
jgi:hypothetical protein